MNKQTSSSSSSSSPQFYLFIKSHKDKISQYSHGDSRFSFLLNHAKLLVKTDESMTCFFSQRKYIHFMSFMIRFKVQYSETPVGFVHLLLHGFFILMIMIFHRSRFRLPLKWNIQIFKEFLFLMVCESRIALKHLVVSFLSFIIS